MKVPLSWLKDYVDITVPPEDLAHTLTMAGLEVEAIEYIGADWGDKIITAQIVHLEKVPGSDHLTYARVITGKEEPGEELDRKSTRLNSSHRCISYAVFCLKKKKKKNNTRITK